MKKIAIPFLCLILLCGCKHASPLQHDTAQIVRIELVDNHSNEFSVLYELTDSDITTFIDDLSNVTCKKNLHPIEDLGAYAVCIYYANGDADIIGTQANAYITDGKYVLSGWYGYNETELQDLIAKYVDR